MSAPQNPYDRLIAEADALIEIGKMYFDAGAYGRAAESLAMAAAWLGRAGRVRDAGGGGMADAIEAIGGAL